MNTLLLLFAFGCGSKGGDPAFERDEEPVVDTEPLVLEVLPSLTTEPDGTPRAFPQSLDDPPFEVNVLLELQRPVLLEGAVFGTDIAPGYRADLPSTDGPVAAVVHLDSALITQSVAAATDLDGLFAAPVLPGSYDLTVVPSDPMVPLASRTVEVENTPPFLELELGQGASVWGRVLEDGIPIAGAVVRGVTASGLQGALAETDTDGWYQLRVEPGEYRIQTLGSDNGFDPTLTTPLQQIGSAGLRMDFDYPTLQLHAVDARAVDSRDDTVPGVPYRLRSINLEGYEESAAVEITGFADNRGNIVTRAVAGTYDLEVLPEGALTSARVESIFIDGSTNIGDVELAAFTDLAGNVIDTLGSGVPGAQVSCSEAGFQGRSWTTFSSDLGNWTLNVPASMLSCAISPPGDRKDLALTRETLDPVVQDEIDFEFLRGRAMFGTVEFEGRPEPFAIIEIRDTSGQIWGSALTNEDGSYALRVQYPQ